MTKFQIRLAVGLGSLAIILILLLTSMRFVVVEGSERVVWQTLSGVQDTIGEDGLHFYFGWTTTPNEYYIGSDTFIIDDVAAQPNNEFMDTDELRFNQPDVSPIQIPVQMDKLTEQDIADGKTTGPTPVMLRCVMQYHLDPGKLTLLHKQKTKSYRTTFIKDVLFDKLITQTTVLDARTVYQGAGRVALQRNLEKELKEDDRFEKYGIIVERFIIREITLKDTDFLQKITEEARAEQRRKTAVKTKAAFEAEAQAAEAEALAEQKKRLVEAETKKQEQIASAEAEARQQVVAAEAAKSKTVLNAEAEADEVKLAAAAQMEKDRMEGEGLKLRKIAEAEGVLALGKAEAEAKKLQLLAYEGEGGHRFAEVEKAKHLGAGIQKIYYIPSSMSLNTIAKDFQGAIAIGLPGNGGMAKAKAEVKGPQVAEAK